MSGKKKALYILAVIALCALLFVLFMVGRRTDDSAGTLPDSAEATWNERTTAEPVSSDVSLTVSVPASESAVSESTAVQTTGSTSLPIQTAPAVTAGASPQTMTKAEILAVLSDAVNKTKAYTGAVSVHHTEGFSAEIQSITGGDLVASFANRLIGSVVAPVDETLSFSGGTAVNSEGETVPLLLPKRGAFTLTESGVASATVSQSGQNTVVDITLVSESVGMNEIPTANAAAIGYLDVSSIDISILTVQSANITYSGSTIHAVINPDGYIASATYTIPLYVEGSASAIGISGSAVFTGQETESWTINW